MALAKWEITTIATAQKPLPGALNEPALFERSASGGRGPRFGGS